jgi:hypothetical protein
VSLQVRVGCYALERATLLDAWRPTGGRAHWNGRLSTLTSLRAGVSQRECNVASSAESVGWRWVQSVGNALFSAQSA